MAQTIIIHVENSDPILAEVEDVDNLDGSALECTNLRRRDGKQVQPIVNQSFSTPNAARCQAKRGELQRWERYPKTTLSTAQESRPDHRAALLLAHHPTVVMRTLVVWFLCCNSREARAPGGLPGASRLLPDCILSGTISWGARPLHR